MVNKINTFWGVYYTALNLILFAEKWVSSITLKDVRVENVPGQAVRVWNTDPEKHNVIWLERMSVSNTGHRGESTPALDVQLKSAYVLIRNCFFNKITARNSTVMSVTFDSETMSRVSTAKVTQNSFVSCEGGGVISVRNSGQNNATLRLTNNNLRHNSANDRHSVVQLVNMSVLMEGNLIHDNIGKYTLELGNDDECSRLPVRAGQNIFWNNNALSNAAKYTVSLHASDVMFRKNIFNNPSNTFEMSSDKLAGVNASDAVIDCTHNWWGSGRAYDVTGEIRDGHLVEDLPIIEFVPFDPVPPNSLHFSSR